VPPPGLSSFSARSARHSFPTRRSSDLNIQALVMPLIGIGVLLRLSGEGLRRGALGTALAGFGLLFLGIDMLRAGFTALPSDFTLDRKSTRLNSSHVKISYAVFCLKKKT